MPGIGYANRKAASWAAFPGHSTRMLFREAQHGEKKANTTRKLHL